MFYDTKYVLMLVNINEIFLQFYLLLQVFITTAFLMHVYMYMYHII
jgi:hypothetical protein